MDKNEILEKVQDIFRTVLDDEDIVLSNESTADDIEEWDSLNNLLLLVQIEKTFGVKFTSSESSSWQNVGEMIESLHAKLK